MYNRTDKIVAFGLLVSACTVLAVAGWLELARRGCRTHADRPAAMQLPATDAPALPELRIDYLLRMGYPAPFPERISRQSIRHSGVSWHRVSDTDFDLSALAPHLVSSNHRERALYQGSLCCNGALLSQLDFQVS